MSEIVKPFVQFLEVGDPPKSIGSISNAEIQSNAAINRRQSKAVSLCLPLTNCIHPE
jgi:hypothetical protein